jgi:enoyl-CoA hydratase
MAEYSNLRFEVQDGVATVTIDRPDKLNALDHATLLELAAVVRAIREDDSIAGAIVTGSGAKAFVAGADIAELARLDPIGMREAGRLGNRIFREIELLRKPVIAAVNGFALGGGCELALACHLRLAAPNARFGFPEVKLGIIPGYGGTLRLPRIVGKGRALELILTGEMIGADEAHRIGLANRVVREGDLLDAAHALLRQILQNGPLALGLAIESATHGLEMDLDAAIAFESSLFGLLASTADMREGMAAFLEKRKAEFRGR